MNENLENIWIVMKDRLRSFILSRIPDEFEADDILQDVFLKIHDHIDSLIDGQKFQSWVYQITRNSITDYYRKKSRTGQQVKFPVAEEADEADAGSENLMAEMLRDMTRMMDELPPEDCEALCLTELGGMSQIEYAKMIGISYSGAKSRVQRAKQKLKDLLMKCCHYQFDTYGTVIDIKPVNCCCCH